MKSVFYNVLIVPMDRAPELNHPDPERAAILKGILLEVVIATLIPDRECALCFTEIESGTNNLLVGLPLPNPQIEPTKKVEPFGHFICDSCADSADQRDLQEFLIDRDQECVDTVQ